MSVFDISTPAGTEVASQGDDRMRELKVALQDALRGETTEGSEAVFPGAAPSTAPVFRYRGLSGLTAARPAAGQYGLFFDTTRQVLQRDNGSSWDDVGTVIPAGTVMVFYQAAAPAGWTQVVTQNDKALRVVSGSGGVAGGSQGLSSTIFIAHNHNVLSHTHTISHKHYTGILAIAGQLAFANGLVDWPSGTTSIGLLANIFAGSASAGASTQPALNTSPPDTTDSGSTAGTTDSQLADVNLAYADVILCSKN